LFPWLQMTKFLLVDTEGDNKFNNEEMESIMKNEVLYWLIFFFFFRTNFFEVDSRISWSVSIKIDTKLMWEVEKEHSWIS
jgi:hypothetical protein